MIDEVLVKQKAILHGFRLVHYLIIVKSIFDHLFMKKKKLSCENLVTNRFWGD